MENTITIPASITIDETTFTDFTDALGYQTMVEDPNDENNMIQNPETRLEFAQRQFKEEVLLPWLLQFSYRRINKEVDESAHQQKTQLRQQAHDELAPSVTVG